MFHRFHLLMENADNKNIMLALPVKNGVSLVIVTANPIGYFGARISHERRAGQELKSALQMVGISISLYGAKSKQGVFVDSGEIFYRKIRQLIHGAAASPGRQC